MGSGGPPSKWPRKRLRQPNHSERRSQKTGRRHTPRLARLLPQPEQPGTRRGAPPGKRHPLTSRKPPLEGPGEKRPRLLEDLPPHLPRSARSFPMGNSWRRICKDRASCRETFQGDKRSAKTLHAASGEKIPSQRKSQIAKEEAQKLFSSLERSQKENASSSSLGHAL